MNETLGSYVEIANSDDIEQLNLSFSPSSLPLKQRWRNNGLSADFLGDYVTTFFPKDDSDPETSMRQAEIKGSVAYIANEVLENAMKYAYDNNDSMISISVFLLKDKIIFNGTNDVVKDQFEQLSKTANELLENDTNELFIQRMEENALSDTSAGLGLLTMINDYDANIAWKYTSTSNDVVNVTTQVTIKI